MKNTNEIAESVFRRRDEISAKKAKQRKTLTRVGAVLTSLILVGILAFAGLKNLRNPSADPADPDTHQSLGKPPTVDGDSPQFSPLPPSSVDSGNDKDHFSPEPSGGSGCEAVPHLDFPSVQDFYDTVAGGLLTPAQAMEYKQFPQDEEGNILLCDFDNLVVPLSPEGVVGNVYWTGETYSCSADLEQGGSFTFTVHTKRTFDKEYQRYCEDYFKIYDSIVITKQETVEGKTVTDYASSTAEMRREQYTLTDGTRTLTVIRTYLLSHNLSPTLGGPTSDTVPNEILLYVQDGDIRYSVFLHNPTQAPTDQWLLGFNATPLEK